MRARGAGAGAGRADGDRRGGGQDHATATSSASSSSGRSRRGCRAVETIAAAREQGGLVGIPHPFDRMRGSLLRDARDGEPGAAGRLGRGPQRPAGRARQRGCGRRSPREHGLPGVAVSDAHSIMEVGVAYTALDGDPSTPAGLLAALAERRDRARVGRPTSSASGRRSPRASTGSAATAASSRSRPATARPPRERRRHGQDHRPMADGTTAAVGSARWRPHPRSIDADPARRRARSLDAARGRARPRSPRSRSAQRLRQPRTILSIVVPLAIIAFFLYLNRERLAAGPGAHPPGQPGARPARLHRVLPRLPVARLSLEAAPARDRLRHQPAQLGRDPVHLVVRQLRRAGQARRRLPRLPAQDEQRGVAQPDLRDGLHRARSSTSSRSRSSAWRPASGASATGCRRRSGWSSSSASWSWSWPPIGLFTMRNFGRRILDQAAPAAEDPRALRALRGGRLRRRRASATCRSSRS